MSSVNVHHLAIVSGVDSFDQMLSAPLKAVSSEAEKKGAKIGLSGKKFLENFG